jgi:hypothetical protein
MLTQANGVFPLLQDIMDLARSIVNDMYKGVGNTNGRILTNDANFTLPYLNSAGRTVYRKLRNEGVTFPIKDNVKLLNIPIVDPPSVQSQIEIGYDGTFNGQVMSPLPALPPDLVQPLVVRAQLANSQTPYCPLVPAQQGLPSGLQGPTLGPWDWRDYKICLNGSTQLWNLDLRYTSGLRTISAQPSQFATTRFSIIDSCDAMAYWVAVEFGQARGADTSKVEAKFTEAIADMALEWVRQQQERSFRRIPYGNQDGPLGGNNSSWGGIT